MYIVGGLEYEECYTSWLSVQSNLIGHMCQEKYVASYFYAQN